MWIINLFVSENRLSCAGESCAHELKNEFNTAANCIGLSRNE